MRPEVTHTIEQLSELAERSADILQVGRTHLQDTSPVPLGTTLAGYAARIADRVERADEAFGRLRGKMSGIVGTGAGIDAVVGDSIQFEREVLAKLGLQPDYTATQIVQKERLADAGHSIVTLGLVLADFAEDTRMLYSSAIGEVTSKVNAERLGGSSADATKNNPISYENIAGKVVIPESGMAVLYRMIVTNLQRDLRGSVQARYQPQGMIVQVHESFERVNKALPNFSVIEDQMALNLESVRKKPSEAMVAILRGQGYVHPEYGVGHSFVREIGKRAIREGKGLLEVAREDQHFRQTYERLPEAQQQILQGKIELYTGSARQRMEHNLVYARDVVRRSV